MESFDDMGTKSPTAAEDEGSTGFILGREVTHLGVVFALTAPLFSIRISRVDIGLYDYIQHCTHVRLRVRLCHTAPVIWRKAFSDLSSLNYPVSARPFTFTNTGTRSESETPLNGYSKFEIKKALY